MAIIHVTETTVGAPNSGRISGTAGDLYAMLKYALPLNGWAVEYDDAVNFGAVFRPAVGNRFRLFVLDNATASGNAGLALVRGCENASAATTAGIVDPFPTVLEIADASSNWVKSSAANTTARNFDIFVGPTWVFYAVNMAGTTNVWDIHFFGDVPPTLSGDAYNTICAVRGSTAAGTTSNIWTGTNSTSGITNWRFCRSYDATVKATSAGAWMIGAFFGANGGSATMRSGPTTGIDRGKVTLLDTGSTSTTISSTTGLPQRAYLPNLWNPLHNGRGTVNSRDIITDTVYNPSASFTVFTRDNTSTSPAIIVETTDTWSPPSG
jgi:hypothetical protein